MVAAPIISEMKRSRNGSESQFRGEASPLLSRTVRRAWRAATSAGSRRIGRTLSIRMVKGYDGSGTPQVQSYFNTDCPHTHLFSRVSLARRSRLEIAKTQRPIKSKVG